MQLYFFIFFHRYSFHCWQIPYLQLIAPFSREALEAHHYQQHRHEALSGTTSPRSLGDGEPASHEPAVSAPGRTLMRPAGGHVARVFEAVDAKGLGRRLASMAARFTQCPMADDHGDGAPQTPGKGHRRKTHGAHGVHGEKGEAGGTTSGINAAVEATVKAAVTLGLQVSVWRRGARLCSVAAGRLGTTDSRAVEHDTLFNAFSVSKVPTPLIF
jgi:hypothetical protein